jgi:hypothetical protein
MIQLPRFSIPADSRVSESDTAVDHRAMDRSDLV